MSMCGYLVLFPYGVWQFRCQRLPAPALISPLIDYVLRWIALPGRLYRCIARRCQIVSSFVLGGCCVALQMLMPAGVLSSLGSVVTRCKRKNAREWTEKMSACAVVLMFSRSSREKCTWMDWKNVCLCASNFHVVEPSTLLLLWKI